MYNNNILTTDKMYIWHTEGDAELFKDFERFDGNCSHSHTECEIYYLLQGDMGFWIEGREYRLVPDSLLLIPPNNFHWWKYRSAKLHHRVTIHFLPELLDETEQAFFLSLFNTGPLFFTNVSLFNINFLVQSLVECGKMEDRLQSLSLKNRTVSLLSQILFLCSNHAIQPVSEDKRIQAVIKYVGDHLREKLHLDGISRECNISKNHLNVLFRRATGTTVSQYIRIKRLALARQEILSGFPLEEAAYNAGFNDYSNFYRAYKSFYDCMPSSPVVSRVDLEDPLF